MFHISYAQLLPELWVGSYPQSPEDILHLKSIGVNAVLSVQSDEDLASRAMNWELFWKFYMAQGFQVARVPITDFDRDDLLMRIDLAVGALDDLVRRGARVYLHCTAGLNRSPTIAVAWLARHRQMTLAQAYEHVTSRRQCAIYQDVLAGWIKKHPSLS